MTNTYISPTEWAKAPKVGDFVSYTLVTDTVIYEVVGVTAKTIKVRGTRKGEIIASENVGGNPYPVVYREAVSVIDYPVQTVRLRKDGTYRLDSWSPLRPATMIDGKPVTVTDYRM